MGLMGSPETHARGVEWWNERFGSSPDDRVNFSVVFFPAFVKSCRQEMPTSDALSMEELRVVAKYCVADSAWQHDTISRTEFLHFVARFGPLESSVQRMLESLTVHRELVTWFHSTITRAEAEKALLSSSMEDGAFLVRFSESQPTRFCLSYVKIHSSGPHIGRRELRNVLIENIGPSGFVLTDTRNKAYPSIRGFIQRSASRLKHGIASPFARRCNSELAAVRARQDRASNSYTSFSTESLDPSSSSPSSPSFRTQRPPASLLFSKTPPLGPRAAPTVTNNQEDHDDNYGGFAMDSLMPPALSLKTTASVPNGVSNHAKLDDYGSFSAATMMSRERSPPGSPARTGVRKVPVITPPPGSDYGDFSAFTASITSFSRVSSSPPRRPNFDYVPNSNNNNSADEYASFEAFAPAISRPVVPPAAVSTASIEDTYGAFDAFNLHSSSPAAREPIPPTPVSEVGKEDDYGSFANLTSLAGSPVRRPLAATRPVSQPVPVPEDTYGAFTLSPTLAGQAQQVEALGPPPLSLNPAEAAAPSIPPMPTKSLSSDTYGSFESLLAAASAETEDAAHSAPPDLSAITSSVLSEESSETKASALDELNAGMEFFKKKNRDDALLCFIRAREVAKSSEDAVVEARALGNMGTVYLDKQNPQQAVKCYEQCLEITRSIKDIKRERTILNNLVLALMAAEDFDSAYKYCQIQLETTLSEVNRRKILFRMSLLREQAARASREARNGGIRPPLSS